MSNTSDSQITLKQVADVAARIGYCLLKYGAEINRVEDTASRICRAYGVKSDVFAIASSIVITVEQGGVSFTQTRRITGVETNLDRVEHFNALSRKLCSESMSYSRVIEEIERIENRHLYHPLVSCFAYAMIGGGFAVFFGGGVLEGVLGFAVGFIVRIIILISNLMLAPAFFTNAFASAATVLCSHLAELVIPQLNAEMVNIGVLMNLVPGILLTNCMRDFVSNDFTSGVSRIIEAFFVAAAIALGVAVSFLWR